MSFSKEITQPAVTCSKLTIETLEQGVRYVQSQNTLVLKSKKVQDIFGEIFILALLSSAVFRQQNRVSDIF